MTLSRTMIAALDLAEAALGAGAAAANLACASLARRMTLPEIQSAIVARIDTRPVGSSSRFRLMDAADALSKAIEAEQREGVPVEAEEALK